MGGMAVTATQKLDVERIRADFPYLEQLQDGKPVAFLDSAATSQKPRQVLDAMTQFYETSYANVHRGVYRLAERATEGLEGAREKVRALLNAPSAREVIFVRNATEGINLVAYSWGLNELRPGRPRPRHRARAPLELRALAVRREPHRRDFRMLPLDENGELRWTCSTRSPAAMTVKVVAAGLTSNSLGTNNPIERSPRGRTSAARSSSATRRRPHRTAPSTCRRSAATSSRCPATRCAARAASAASGAAPSCSSEMEPFLLGGHMIRSGRRREDDLGRRCRHKFEAGTAPMAEAVGLGAAIDYLEGVGLDAIEQHEHALAAYALEALGELPGVTLYGPPAERRAGIVSFNVEGVHPHDVAQILDLGGIAIRAGHHCCQPLMRKLGVAATNRASFYLYDRARRHRSPRSRPQAPRVASAGRMGEFEDMYREVILDHYKNPRNYGPIEDPDAHTRGPEPALRRRGLDLVRFGADGETIEDIGFEGRGCAISQAATSMLTGIVKATPPGGRAVAQGGAPRGGRDGGSRRSGSSAPSSASGSQGRTARVPRHAAAGRVAGPRLWT